MADELMRENMPHLTFPQLDAGQPDHPIELLIEGRALAGD